MRIFEWIAELRFRNPLLYRVGLIHFVLAILLLVPMALDSRQVLGINTWIKPMKFCLSIWIYLWTFGWMLFDLPDSRKWIKLISWTAAVTMIVEIIVILYQAGRATQSHFNEETLFDGMLFATMGIMIVINTIAIFVTFFLFLKKKPNLDSAYLLSIRVAFVVYIMGNMVGGMMIKNKAHSVGVVDGGPGLPILSWSTVGGDLRIAHFLGLHAIQLIPLFSYYLLKKTNWSMTNRRIGTLIFTACYGGLLTFLYYHAMGGKPLF